MSEKKSYTRQDVMNKVKSLASDFWNGKPHEERRLGLWSYD